MLIIIGALVVGLVGGAYAEAKLGAKAKADVAAELAAAKQELGRLKSAASAVASDVKNA